MFLSIEMAFLLLPWFGGLSVENRTVQRGCADSTVATVATHPVGEGGKRQRRLACYVHTVATA